MTVTVLKPRAATPDQGAFRDIYLAYVDRVQRKIHLMVGHRHAADVEDLVQEVFVQVYRNFSAFRGDSQLSTWIYRIAVNVALQHLRSKKRYQGFFERFTLFKADEPPIRTPEDVVSLQQVKQRLTRCMQALSDKQRVVFVLYEIEGHTLGEIAAMTDNSINTVASRLRTARARLQEQLACEKRAAGEGGEL